MTLTPRPQSLRNAAAVTRETLVTLAAAAVAVGVAGCTVGPDYQPPRVTVLDHYGEQGPESTRRKIPIGIAAPDAGTRVIAGRPPVVAWWTTFNDPALDELIGRAIDGNLDLRRAAARVREARAQRGVVRADLFPDVNTAASYEHVRASGNGVASAFGGGSGGSSSGGSSSGGSSSGGSGSGGSSGGVNVGGSGSGAPGANGSAAIPGMSVGEFDLYQVGFDASYELDVFGGTRRAVEAADASLQAAVEDRRDVLLSLMGEVARDYVNLRATQRRIKIAQDNLAVQERTTSLIRELVRQGVNNEFDLTRAEAQVLTTRATLPPLEAQAGQLIHALSTLLGERPTALAERLTAARPVPPSPDEVPIGLPSDLIRRRPDVRRAERELASQTASIGVAVADLLPKFALNGSIGTQAVEPRHLVDYASRYFSIGPSVSFPLFDAGRNKNRVRVAEARRDQAMASFQQSVLVALRDVEDALIGYDRAQQRARTLAEAAEANRKAVRIAQDLYSQGLTDFLSVLDAQRSLFASEDALAMSEGERATSLVALYKSLGGGWESAEPTDPYGPTTAQPVVASR